MKTRRLFPVFASDNQRRLADRARVRKTTVLYLFTSNGEMGTWEHGNLTYAFKELGSLLSYCRHGSAVAVDPLVKPQVASDTTPSAENRTIRVQSYLQSYKNQDLGKTTEAFTQT